VNPQTGYRWYSPEQLEQLAPYIESLTAWISEQHRQPAGGLRQLLIANRDSGGHGPDGQWAFALAAS
jgi:hypothetical protein